MFEALFHQDVRPSLLGTRRAPGDSGLIVNLFPMELLVDVWPDQMLLIPASIQQPARPCFLPKPFHGSEADINSEQILALHIGPQMTHFPSSVKFRSFSPVRIVSDEQPGLSLNASGTQRDHGLDRSGRGRPDRRV